MPHEARKRKGIKVISLDDYRKEKQPVIPTIEIRLLPGGGIGYSKNGINEGDAFRALLGCYAVAGELLQTLREKMRCTSGSCGTSE